MNSQIIQSQTLLHWSIVCFLSLDPLRLKLDLKLYVTWVKPKRSSSRLHMLLQADWRARDNFGMLMRNCFRLWKHWMGWEWIGSWSFKASADVSHLFFSFFFLWWVFYSLNLWIGSMQNYLEPNEWLFLLAWEQVGDALWLDEWRTKLISPCWAEEVNLMSCRRSSTTGSVWSPLVVWSSSQDMVSPRSARPLTLTRCLCLHLSLQTRLHSFRPTGFMCHLWRLGTGSQWWRRLSRLGRSSQVDVKDDGAMWTCDQGRLITWPFGRS